MAVKYVTLGQDLSSCAGQRLRVDSDGERLYMEDNLHISGTDGVDGSLRLAVDGDTGFVEVQKRVSGIWQPGSFQIGSTSLWVGNAVAVAAVGHHLATESHGHLHFLAHGEFDGSISATDAQIVHAYAFVYQSVVQGDNTGSWTGTVLNVVIPSTEHSIQKGAYFQTHSIAATQLTLGDSPKRLAISCLA